MDEIGPLEKEIRRRIAAAGPMPIDQYMNLCLADPQHGYYTTRDPLGAHGDFITAPEISQMFGELIGLWMTAVWKQMGAPANVRIVELGPGRGTLMKDALRAAELVPEFRKAIVVHLVELSPVLKAQQEQTLGHLAIPVYWHATLDDVPEGPAIVAANEFFDALPVKQAVKSDKGWHERRIGIGDDGKFFFTAASDPLPHFELLLPPDVRGAPIESIFEWRADGMAIALGRRVAKGGAALVIDYGHAKSAVGDTLQAVGRHSYADPLTAPGTVDLTAHVDFQPLTVTMEALGTKSFGPISQSDFLRRLGIETRATMLKANATRAAGAAIDSALARLTGHGRTGMGELFKAAACTHPALGAPPGFET